MDSREEKGETSAHKLRSLDQNSASPAGTFLLMS